MIGVIYTIHFVSSRYSLSFKSRLSSSFGAQSAFEEIIGLFSDYDMRVCEIGFWCISCFIHFNLDTLRFLFDLFIIYMCVCVWLEMILLKLMFHFHCINCSNTSIIASLCMYIVCTFLISFHNQSIEMGIYQWVRVSTKHNYIYIE